VVSQGDTLYVDQVRNAVRAPSTAPPPLPPVPSSKPSPNGVLDSSASPEDRTSAGAGAGAGAGGATDEEVRAEAKDAEACASSGYSSNHYSSVRELAQGTKSEGDLEHSSGASVASFGTAAAAAAVAVVQQEKESGKSSENGLPISSETPSTLPLSSPSAPFSPSSSPSSSLHVPEDLVDPLLNPPRQLPGPPQRHDGAKGRTSRRLSRSQHEPHQQSEGGGDDGGAAAAASKGRGPKETTEKAEAEAAWTCAVVLLIPVRDYCDYNEISQ